MTLVCEACQQPILTRDGMAGVGTWERPRYWCGKCLDAWMRETTQECTRVSRETGE